MAQQITIPKEVRPIYDRLKSKYALEFETVVVKKRRFQILHLKDIEPLIAGKDIFAQSEEFPYWVKIWEASVVMADFMAGLPAEPGRRVLELGAGLGVTGLVASAFGHEVTITDYQDEILDFGRVSAAVNKCRKVSFETLDWLSPADIGTFDMIIGSEILFHPKFFEPLLHVFRKYLAPGGVIYMAHDRRRKSLGQFLPLCDKEYHIAVQKRMLKALDEVFEIVLTRLSPRD